MRRLLGSVGITALVASTLIAGTAGSADAIGASRHPVAHASAKPAPKSRAALPAGHMLVSGQRLESTNGRFSATLGPTGRLVVRGPKHRLVWRTPAAGRPAHVSVTRTGQVLLRSRGRTVWRSNTAGSGRGARLAMQNDGVLALTVRRALVWSTRLTNVCPKSSGKLVVVRIEGQSARACDAGRQIRAFRVTTGATDHGDVTPRGTWHVQSKIRDTTLYPAAGGAYPVHFWVPYDGAYGIHDAPWQKFPFGSPKYRTQGSHGCTHVPEATMKWLFGWLRIGTTVVIS
jgi:hypothetical protein